MSTHVRCGSCTGWLDLHDMRCPTMFHPEPKRLYRHRKLHVFMARKDASLWVGHLSARALTAEWAVTETFFGSAKMTSTIWPDRNEFEDFGEL